MPLIRRIKMIDSYIKALWHFCHLIFFTIKKTRKNLHVNYLTSYFYNMLIVIFHIEQIQHTFNIGITSQ
jgi:hypothetical protein